ncbi:MAG TPA: hypothetical protein VHO69_11450 [Phototrophicaceae bacterium]|nr:hypothetical protein [Phototrophicaceae bacterium]
MASWPNKRLFWLTGLLTCLILAACSGDEVPAAVPTLTLIPATLTYTPLPALPTVTHAALPGPGDLASTPATAETTPEADPVAAELVRLAQRRLGETLDLPTLRLRVIEVMPVHWLDSSLGCPLPNQTYTTVAIDGYRIVLAAGEQEYIFHSDFDRVLPCDPTNEQLPDAE